MIRTAAPDVMQTEGARVLCKHINHDLYLKKENRVVNKIFDTINSQKNNHQKQKITKRKEKMEAESEIIQKKEKKIY